MKDQIQHIYTYSFFKNVYVYWDFSIVIHIMYKYVSMYIFIYILYIYVDSNVLMCNTIDNNMYYYIRVFNKKNMI